MSLPPFTNIANTAIDPDSPITTELMTAYRDNTEHNYDWIGKNFTPEADHDHDGVNSKTVNQVNVYGDGSDGSFDTDVDGLTLAGGFYCFTTFIVQTGDTLVLTDGWAWVRCTGTATVDGTIDGTSAVDGGPASGTGTGNTGDTFMAGQAWAPGGQGGFTDSGVGGGAGAAGAGGSGGDGGIGGGGTVATGSVSKYFLDRTSGTSTVLSDFMPPEHVKNLFLMCRGGGGGEGGGSASAGGAGGDGGGMLVIAAKGIIDVDGSIDCSGDDGSSSGGEGGGGGGGGGAIGLFSGDTVTGSGSLDAHGGDGGSGGGGGGTHHGGGGAGGGVIVATAAGGTPALTTDITAGSGGSAPDGSPGSAGSAGFARQVTLDPLKAGVFL